jgi:hypothetical protein
MKTVPGTVFSEMAMKRQTIVFLQRIRELSPIIAVVMLLVLPIFLPDESVSSAAFEQRNARIAAAMGEIPWQIGRWRGVEVPVPSVAQDVLRPNALLSRSYREIGGNLQATLVIVHCSDTRDMLGHYPPVCYPANGWQAVKDVGGIERIGADIGIHPSVDCMRYDFYLNTDLGSKRGIRIYNFFVLPGGVIAHELSELQGQAGRTRTSAMGVAQVQIAFSDQVSDEEAGRALAELLEGIQPLFVVLGSIDHVKPVQ